MDKYTLKPSLSETFKGIIWKVETDDDAPIVAIETRNIADRQASYSAFNYQTGECLFKEISVEDSWSWGIDRVHKGLVFLHSYVHESNPEHKGIIALHTQGDIAWQHFNKTLYDVCDAGLVVYNPKIQPKNLELIAPENGEFLKTLSKPYIPVSKDILVPDVIEDTSRFQQLIPETITGPVFYKQIGEKDIFVYHVKNGELFNQQLAVYQGGKQILKDILAAGIQKLNPAAFFIEQMHLFCIRNNKQEFVSYLV